MVTADKVVKEERKSPKSTKRSEHLERKMPAKGASPLGYHCIRLFEREKGMKKVEAESKLCCCIYLKSEIFEWYLRLTKCLLQN